MTGAGAEGEDVENPKQAPCAARDGLEAESHDREIMT